MKIQVQAEQALLELLRARFPDSSAATLRKWLRHGQVRVEGRIAKRADHALREGETVEIASGREISARPPGAILFRDEHLLAVEKPPGILSVSREGGGEDTFYRRLNEYVRATSGGSERIFIVHRLDREASGIMLFALNAEVQEELQRDWGETEKRYWALVEGAPPEDAGTIRTWLRENSIHRVFSGEEGPDAKLAITQYRLRRMGATRSLVEVRIMTGRKNQIRVHLSELGCPIVGDRRYGARTDPIRRLGLHASLLAFTHPVTGERVRLTLPIPGSFRVD